MEAGLGRTVSKGEILLEISMLNDVREDEEAIEGDERTERGVEIPIMDGLVRHRADCTV